MGEKFNALNQKGKTVQNQVIEKFCNQNEASYFVTPFFVTDAGFGIFIDTKEKTQFIFQENIFCEIPSHTSVTIFTGTMEEIIQDYIRLTGIPKMPPEYAFGVWISANWWNCQSVVEEQIEKLNKYQFPASVIVIEAWSDEATFYIWNGAVNTPKTEGITLEEFDFSKSSQWPDPKGMIDRLHHAGLRLVLWQIPVFKKQDNDEIISEQLSLDKELMSGMDSNNERSPWNIVSTYKCPELITEIKFWHDLRMMLMPYIYSLAQESVFTCKPMMRPMGYVCQKDERCLAISDQYFFGENMIVAPLLEENQRQRELYLPEGSWFGLFSRKRYDGECDLISDEQEKFPVYIKSGTTILLHVEQNFKLLLFGENGEDTLNIENQRIQITWEEGKVIMKGGEGINLMCEFIF